MGSGSRRSRSMIRAAAFVGLVILAAAGTSQGGAPRRANVLHAAKREARDQAQQVREQLQARRKTLPDFLIDGRFNARYERQGLQTSVRARRARAAKIAARGAGAAPDTVDLLIVRMGFAAHRAPGFASMDPSGDFRETPDSTVIIDPPPHGAAYFQAELLGLREYYRIMSHGTLEVRGHVFPPAGEPSLKLSDVADYGPGPDGNWTIELLEHWFRDAVAKLDSASTGRLELSEMESICIVHPGSDLQSDIDRNSPNDIPSFFMTLADSIPVQGGAHEIRNGLVVPETLNQDGLQGGILGVLCHEFGHQLGLPDLYDTNFGLPAVGEWDLMDSGNGLVFAFQVEGSDDVQVAFGVLPGGLSALSRLLLGFEDAYEVATGADSVDLRPANTQQGAGPRIARLNVSADEYFLVENRRDFLAERVEDMEACPYLNRDDSTGVVLWMSRDNPAKPPRERLNSGEYDYFISSPSAPAEAFGTCGEVGFGLLVWHVDERVLADEFAFNSVNGNDKMRALRLLEASGDFEIGDWRSPSDGFVGDGWNDPFREGYRTELRSTTRPNNWNSDWAETGWEITGMRFVAPESHRLVVAVTEGVAGWPFVLRANPDSILQVDPRGALVAPVAGIGTALVAADSNAIWAFTPAGTRQIVTAPLQPQSLAWHPRLGAADANGTVGATDGSQLWLWDAVTAPSTLPVRAGFPAAIPGGTAGRIVLLDETSAGTAGALVETRDGAWVQVDASGVRTTFDVDAGAEPAVVGPVAAGGAPGVALVGRDRFVFGAFTGGGSTVVAHGLNVPDSTLWVAGGALRGTATGPAAQVVALARDGRLRIADADSGLWPGIEDLPRGEYTGLALGDVDGDGELDIVATTATHIFGVTSRGARLPRTPVALQDLYALQNPVRITGGPLVADVAGDALSEILVTTDLGLVYAVDANGRAVAGYPRKMLPDLFPAALLAADWNGDNVPELVGVASLAAAATDPAGGSARAGWTSTGANAARTFFTATPGAVAAQGRILAAEKAFVAYPNPARGGEVRLRLTAAQSGAFALAIYTLEGQRVFERNGTLASGTQEITWRPGGLAPGVYLCRFVSAAAGVTQPLVEPITILR